MVTSEWFLGLSLGQRRESWVPEEYTDWLLLRERI